jgi:hypothetical protein
METDCLALEIAIVESLYLHRKVWIQHTKDIATVLRIMVRPIGWSDPEPYDRLIWLECVRHSAGATGQGIHTFRIQWTNVNLVEEDDG